MIRSFRYFLWTALLLATATSGFAQSWALPAKTPDTPVPCTTCVSVSDPSALTVGYKLPISTFTGRFLDSSSTRDYQATFRTARAWNMLFVPATNRVYFRIGSSVGAYNAEAFFARLGAGEPLMSVSAVPVSPRSGRSPSPDEKWLKWDEFFYPEYINAGWQVNHMDGQERIMGFDADDEGYVYIAASSFGWGIVKDGLTNGNATLMANQFQNANSDFSPFRIMAVKGGGQKKYVLVGSSGARMEVWNATNPKNPNRVASRPTGLKLFAKNTAGDRAAVVDWSGNLTINTGDGFASDGTPLFAGLGYAGVAGDGTNFFALKSTPSGMAISVIVPSSTGYTEQSTVYPTRSGMVPNNLKYGDGYLIVTGSTASSWDMQVFKVSNLALTEVALNGSPGKSDYPSYFRNYYSSPPTGYVAPEGAYINILDGGTYKSNSTGKTYVIICAKGLGDVYELKGSDSVTVTSDGRSGTINTSAPPSTKIYYGDPVSFTASTSSTQVPSVSWNFGNPEAGSDNTGQISATNAPMTYAYRSQFASGIATTFGSKPVVATSVTDSAIKGSTTVIIEQPTARFGIAGLGTKYLFTQPNASSPAPIVLGDTFVDASDGLVEGHYSSWTIDGVTTKQLANVPMAVGDCGQHTVTFLGMYGPYTGAGSTLTTSSTPYALGLGASNGSVTYSVRPFAAAVEVAASDATSLVFHSASRPAGILSTVTYKWDLVDSNGAVVTAGPTGTGAAPNWTVLKTTLTQRGMRVRLTLTSPPTTGACAGMETSVAFSTPLNAPDPVVAQSGNCNGAPCTFTVSSTSNVDTVADGWTYNWEVLNAATGAADTVSWMAASGTHTSVFDPTFIKTGSFTVRVTVTNAINSIVLTKSVTVTTPSTSCKTMGPNSFTVGISCSPCTAGQTATFVASNYEYLTGGYDAACSPHTYNWTFPDGSTASGVSVDKVVALSGTVNVAISNGVETRTYQGILTVGSGGGGGGGNPGGGGGENPCGTFNSSNVFISYSGAGGCSTGVACNKGISINFIADPWGYSFDCASHNFSWNFGDGTNSAGGRNVNHTYSSEGTKTVSVTITSPYAVVTKTAPITISGTGTGTNPCGTMNSTNVGITYTAASGCTETSGTACKNNETINFDAAAYLGYSFSCASHSFSWDFGDGSAAVNGKTASHSFTTSGSHTVRLTVSNQYQPNFVRQLSVTTGSTTGQCGTIQPNVNLAILYSNAANTCGPLGSACAAGEVINFLVKDYAPYAISCGTHTYDWDFGDGSAHSNSATPSHQYQAGGTYTAKCTINNGTETKTLQQPVVINGSPASTTVDAHIDVTPMPGVANGYIFTGSAKPDGVVTRWVWNFGDNNTAEGQTQAHVYSNNDPRTVTLTVYNAQGQAVGTDNIKLPLINRRRSVRH